MQLPCERLRFQSILPFLSVCTGSNDLRPWRQCLLWRVYRSVLQLQSLCAAMLMQQASAMGESVAVDEPYSSGAHVKMSAPMPQAWLAQAFTACTSYDLTTDVHAQ